MKKKDIFEPRHKKMNVHSFKYIKNISFAHSFQISENILSKQMRMYFSTLIIYIKIDQLNKY